MLSQNGATERDRFQAKADFDTDVKSEAEIEESQRTLARIALVKLDKIITLPEAQAQDAS